MSNSPDLSVRLPRGTAVWFVTLLVRQDWFTCIHTFAFWGISSISLDASALLVEIGSRDAGRHIGRPRRFNTMTVFVETGARELV
ncbi:hypothetical protein [Bradyrhizobium sp. JYMT SZCCT0428]|uniref:hypothetical protein n=1 Tax=Bradyrhizobium sp. JYMT SZCCT0428 TaxID=2807673 RepID=UPI001BAA0131|nr:hypothetical protein [Bradyrhizobium sp. JYMT SZCCT0428]MBR1153603.1 hypothetical protein [Bradyrhizobium sp. JYMT SZCCT0428]